MTRSHKIKLSIFVLLTICFTYLGLQKYKYPDRSELQLKINYLSKFTNQSNLNQSDLSKLEEQNPEWNLFSYSFACFALTNISFLDSSFKNQAVELIDLSIQKVMSDKFYKNYFSKDHPFTPNIDSSGSILYLAHLNTMLGCYRLLSNNTKYNTFNDQLSKSIYSRFTTAKFKCLESYPGLIWIPDNTAALASLKLHSLNSGNNYEILFKDWIAYARKNWIDSKTGLLCSTIHIENGAALEEPRGSMIGWSIFFIYRFDKAFAKELYECFKDKFSTNLLVLRIFKERYKNLETNVGDIDSGPIFLGFSIPANAFAFGNAVAFKDVRNAKRLQRLIKLGSKRIIKDQALSYQSRFIDLPISPLAESLILYFETMTDWTVN